ncbi:hypothetical protein ACFOOL_06885 [Devosia honganensis]|uniref:Uncharacterized protein n=1 Tax=Devosia honganensis TaxID=1610527 RepID=A0ABV7X104_9HYPH
MAIHSNAGSRLFFSPVSVNPDTINAMSDGDAINFFAAINDWLEVEEKEDIGTIGDTSESINFTAIADKRVRKLKGPKDAGTQSIVVGRDPLDDGQEALIAAEGTDFNYPFKIELNDARTAGHSKSVLYYAGLVMSKANNLGNVSNVVRRNFDVGINTAVFEVASGALSAPVNSLLPSIAGIAQQGETLTALNGSWSNDPTSFAYQWQEDNSGWTNIAGATGITFVPLLAQVGKPLRVIVTAVNGAGSTPATSGATADTLAE